MKKKLNKKMVCSICICAVLLCACSGNNENAEKTSETLKPQETTAALVKTSVSDNSGQQEETTGTSVSKQEICYGILNSIQDESNENKNVECYEVAHAYRYEIEGRYDSGYLDDIMNERYLSETGKEEGYPVNELTNVDYDRDGTVDRIFVTTKTDADSADNDADFKFKIEFGNGLTADVPQFDSTLNDVVFYSCDMDSDGEYEIIVYNHYDLGTESQMCILKKYGSEYRAVPFAVSATEKSNIISGIDVQTCLNDYSDVECYIPVVDYNFKLNLHDYDTEEMDKDRTPYDAWLFEMSADENVDSKNYVRKIKLESKSGFINFEGKNSIDVIFDMDIPVFSSSKAIKSFSAVLVLEDGEIKIKDFREKKN